MNWEFVIAVYAALVASISLIWNIIVTIKKGKPNFIIKIGYVIERSEEKGVYYFKSFRVKAINTKNIPRSIRPYAIEYHEKYAAQKTSKKDIFDNLKFSKILQNSEEYIFNIDDDLFKWIHPENIDKFNILMIDNSGNLYRSKPQFIDHDNFPFSSYDVSNGIN